MRILTMAGRGVALALLLLPLVCGAALAATEGSAPTLVGHPVGIAALVVFVLAYLMVMVEEVVHLRKSVPVLMAAAVMWALVGFGMQGSHAAESAVRHYVLEFGELFLFLLAAMTYINTMEERNVFQAIRASLVSRGLSLRTLFWVTGGLAFCISPIADNLTTALLMGAVAMAVGKGYPRFLTVSCISIVVGANAGGAFSPFGDITTLMVWQKGLVPFGTFFALFLPSLVNWVVPAAFMSLAVEKETPARVDEAVDVKPGGFAIVGMFLATIAVAVLFHAWLGLPPVMGMIGGLGALKLYGWMLSRSAPVIDEADDVFAPPATTEARLDVFKILERAEWDTLMFFAGVILCVGALDTIGYLDQLSALTYTGMGATVANILVGVLSAVIDNIPVMVAVLSMEPPMSQGQWLLVTLTAGVGGSLLSIGSAAGVALMGQARGLYTFGSHLKWTWAVALGYVASIWVHFLVNRGMF